ncbi:electron transfer flavoprotein subunit beta/FixA family protein [Fusobacterium necrophorum]|uniref:Electron transfer flavoprotein subunit beta/FixA family protein n=1 Tax=Fusobacterium necrophorum TaxID=859 RepID=A0A4Q2KXG1_9FUSO|nr:electron transfer flavoprotein subunit beta/FixA family protein [Fusobacterium necrophorum]RXZ70328.1 electron transfer flavoprotein subunit beta/FixA family protein [Fusobacterium necrophorum]
MRIVVCIKQVPDTNEVRINQETGTLIRTGVPSIMNPDDKNALEEALTLKDKYGAEVVVITMGPLQAKEILNEALSMGADRAYLISDRKFGGSDTWATATILAAAIEKVGNYDIVFCGRQAIDGDTAQVGPEIAEFLGLPQITYVKSIELKENSMLEVCRFTEYGDYIYHVQMPVVLTAIKELNVPRYPTISGIIQNYGEEKKEKIETIDFSNLPVDETQIGLKGSPTNVLKSFVPVKNKVSEMIEGDTAKEKTDKLVMKLSAIHLI